MLPIYSGLVDGSQPNLALADYMPQCTLLNRERTILTPPLFMVFGRPFGTSDCSKCSSSSIRRSQKEGVNTGKEKTLGAGKETKLSHAREMQI